MAKDLHLRVFARELNANGNSELNFEGFIVHDPDNPKTRISGELGSSGSPPGLLVMRKI